MAQTELSRKVNGLAPTICRFRSQRSNLARSRRERQLTRSSAKTADGCGLTRRAHLEIRAIASSPSTPADNSGKLIAIITRRFRAVRSQGRLRRARSRRSLRESCTSASSDMPTRRRCIAAHESGSLLGSLSSSLENNDHVCDDVEVPGREDALPQRDSPFRKRRNNPNAFRDRTRSLSIRVIRTAIGGNHRVLRRLRWRKLPRMNTNERQSSKPLPLVPWRLSFLWSLLSPLSALSASSAVKTAVAAEPR